MTQTLRPVTLQLPEADWAALEREAEIVDITLEQLVSLKMRQSLRRSRPGAPAWPDPLSRQRQLELAHWLREASPHFQRAAAEMNLTEEDVVRMVREARRELAEERRNVHSVKL